MAAYRIRGNKNRTVRLPRGSDYAKSSGGVRQDFKALEEFLFVVYKVWTIISPILCAPLQSRSGSAWQTFCQRRLSRHLSLSLPLRERQCSRWD